MININQQQNNIIILYLNEDVSINNPYFIFEFVNTYNEKIIVTLDDESSSETDFSQFNFWDASTTTALYGNGELNVYESVVDTSIVEDLTKIYNGLYKLIPIRFDDITYDPSISYTDSVFDPCSGYNLINQDIVFDPIWASGQIPLLGIPASQIIQSSIYRFVNDSQISSWNSKSENVTFDYIDGSIVVAVDVVDTSLVTYIDGKITDVDTSFGLYQTKINLDSSFGLYETKINLDSSFGDVHSELNQFDASIIRIDASLALGVSSLDALIDVSIGTTLADENVLQYNVDTSTWDNVEVEDAGSYFVLITNLDSSFGLYETKINLDSSLSNKLENTTDTLTGTLTIDDGGLLLTGDARVINHVILSAEIFKLTAAKPAVVNNEGIFITLDFVYTAEKEAYSEGFIPYRWDASTDVQIDIDWFCDADATDASVCWGIDYLSISNNDIIDASTNNILEAFKGNSPGLLQRNTFTTGIPWTDLKHNDIFSFRIYRDHDASSDTLNETARFLALHLHFIRDRLGQAI